MTNHMRTGLLVVMLATGFYGCGGMPPGAPSPIPGPPTEPPVPEPPAPAATLAGTVSDAAWRPLVGARVEVIDGPHAGHSTTTDARGEFRLTGAFDETTRLRATKDGHAAATIPLPAACVTCKHDWWISFHLESEAPHPDITGDYTLTFVANPSCANLPDEARTRTYDATISQARGASQAAGSRFDVRVSSPTILPSFNSFTMGVAGDYLVFEIGDPGHSGAGLVEQVASNRYVTLDGLVTTVLTDPSIIVAPLSGAVYICEQSGAFSDPYTCGGGGVSRGGCHSTNHQLILRRR